MPNAQSPGDQFDLIIQVLRRHGVEFIVIGGQAEVLMGSPRVTYDTDLTYLRTPENLDRLAAALQEIEAKLRGVPEGLPFRLDSRTLAAGNNFTLATKHGALDLLGYVEPIGTFADIQKNQETVNYNSDKLAIITLEDLIRIKRHINRPKDRDSLFQLLAIREHRARQARPQ